MGKANRALRRFIEALPDDKLSGLTAMGYNLYKDVNFRLYMQGVRPLICVTVRAVWSG